MSTSPTPARVTVYVTTPEALFTAARFRWSSDAGVTVEVLDPEWGEIAQVWYDKGMPFDQERRRVTRDEPETFMRALAQPSRSTLYHFADESEPNSEARSE
jgi:hypothetical protein